MKSNKIAHLKERFFKGTLSSEEELQFSELINEKNSGEETLKTYLQMEGNFTGYIPITKEKFFENIHHKNIQRNMWRYLIAVSIVGMLAISSIVFYIKSYQKQSISKVEIEQSMEITRLALNSFSAHFSGGISKVEKGIDLSRTLQPFEKINHQHQKK